MDIRGEIIRENSDRQNLRSESNVHYLPCSVKYDGPANINAYFKTTSSETNPYELTSRFRGRELKGKRIALPIGVVGFFLASDGLGSKSVSIRGHFRSLTIWDHDIAPDTAPISDQFDWLEISKAVSIFNFN